MEYQKIVKILINTSAFKNKYKQRIYMIKKVVIKSGEEMMKALAPKGKLYGLTEKLPEGFNITVAGYPQTFLVDTEAKTFTVEVKETPKPAAPVKEVKKGFNWKKFWIIFGSVVGAIVVAGGIASAIIFSENSATENIDNNATIAVEAEVK